MIRELLRTLGQAIGLLGVGLAARAFRRLPPRGSPVDRLAGGSTAKRRLIKGGMAGAALAVAGFLVAASGIIPIKASSGHWGVTAWFLNFSMSRSVSVHSMMVKTPRLDDPDLLLKGAGHYETGCRPCHGGPGLERPRIPGQMTPHPPDLVEMVPEWNANELFYIVKHGVKFTGMPAWPAQERDDEVWAMVAFLRALPDMNRDEYERLVYGESPGPLSPDPAADTLAEAVVVGSEEDVSTSEADPIGITTADTAAVADPAASVGGDPAAIARDAVAAAGDTAEIAVDEPPLHDLLEPDDVPQTVTESCGRCHGAQGHGRGSGAFPRLAGQKSVYLFAALRAYQRGDRRSGVMEPVAAGMSVDEMREAALYYASLRPSAEPAVSLDTTGAVERGRIIAERGIPEERVPSCADCHGPAQLPRNRAYPRLAGQYADYLVLQLQLFKLNRRGGSAYEHLMQPVAEKLAPEQMRDVALYYASLTSADLGP